MIRRLRFYCLSATIKGGDVHVASVVPGILSNHFIKQKDEILLSRREHINTMECKEAMS